MTEEQKLSSVVAVQYAHVKECSGVLFELPTAEVVAGDTLEMRLWGGTLDLLYPYTLYKGTDTMGSGEILEAQNLEQMIQIIDFAETFNIQLEWPIVEINEVLAVTEIFYEDIDGNIQTWATKGELITPRFARNGYSCFYALDKIKLYGSVKATMTRSPWYKRWYWTIPANEEGLHWFFIYREHLLKNKFSIELPDLSANTTAGELRNIVMSVRDKDTNAMIPGAAVFIDGLSMGLADSEGLLPVEQIETGIHTLKITATGYLDTDVDDLNNETFEVY